MGYLTKTVAVEYYWCHNSGFERRLRYINYFATSYLATSAPVGHRDPRFLRTHYCCLSEPPSSSLSTFHCLVCQLHPWMHVHVQSNPRGMHSLKRGTICILHSLEKIDFLPLHDKMHNKTKTWPEARLYQLSSGARWVWKRFMDGWSVHVLGFCLVEDLIDTWKTSFNCTMPLPYVSNVTLMWPQ